MATHAGFTVQNVHMSCTQNGPFQQESHQQDICILLFASARCDLLDLANAAAKQNVQCQGCSLGTCARELTGRMICASCSSWLTVKGCKSSMLRSVLMRAFPPRLLGATTVVNVLASS